MLTTEITRLLNDLHAQAKAAPDDRLGGHQLAAHWSLAVACNQPPKSWEMYRATNFTNIPTTDFFAAHPLEIQEALKPRATWDLLNAHATAIMTVEDSLNASERTAQGHPGNVQYYDTAAATWRTVGVRRINWFDSRDVYRKMVAQTKDEFCAVVDKRLSVLRKRAEDNPTERNLKELAVNEKYISGGQFAKNLKEFNKRKSSARAYLAKLEGIPDFTRIVFTLLREAENEVRRARGIAAVGEAWVSETELLYRVRQLLPDLEVVAHGQPRWLGRQHLDIWIPSLSVAIEYQGAQHFRSIEFFGGDDAFRRNQERDSKKRALCKTNTTRLIEIAYDQEIDDTTLKKLIVARTSSPY
jgi:hypothetical protein